MKKTIEESKGLYAACGEVYKLRYNFSKATASNVRKRMIRDFMAARTIAVNAINPWFEVWNSEYPEILDDYSESKEYKEYMVRKQDAILQVLNESLKNENCVELYSDAEYLDIRCRNRQDPELTMYVELIPVK